MPAAGGIGSRPSLSVFTITFLAVCPLFGVRGFFFSFVQRRKVRGVPLEIPLVFLMIFRDGLHLLDFARVCYNVGNTKVEFIYEFKP